MLHGRWFAIAATASLLVAGGFIGSLVTAAEGMAATCGDAADITVLPSPFAPWKGAPLRVMVVAEKPIDGELSLTAPDGSAATTSPGRRGDLPDPGSLRSQRRSPGPGTPR